MGGNAASARMRLLGVAPGTPKDRDWKAQMNGPYEDQSIDLPESDSFKLSRAMLILKEREDFHASVDTIDQRLRSDSPDLGLNTEYGE